MNFVPLNFSVFWSFSDYLINFVVLTDRISIPIFLLINWGVLSKGGTPSRVYVYTPL